MNDLIDQTDLRLVVIEAMGAGLSAVFLRTAEVPGLRIAIMIVAFVIVPVVYLILRALDKRDRKTKVTYLAVNGLIVLFVALVVTKFGVMAG